MTNPFREPIGVTVHLTYRCHVYGWFLQGKPPTARIAPVTNPTWHHNPREPSPTVGGTFEWALPSWWEIGILK